MRRSVGGHVRGPGDRASKQTTSREPTHSEHAEGHDGGLKKVGVDRPFSPGSQSSARAHMPHARKPGDHEGTASGQSTDAQTRQGESRNPSSQAFEESDAGVVPTWKKSAKTRVTPVESMEGRPAADEEIRSTKRTPDAEPDSCAKLVERVGQRARHPPVAVSEIRCSVDSSVGARCGKSARRVLSGGAALRPSPTGTP